MRVGFPVGGFAATGDDDTGPGGGGCAGADGDGGGKVHQEGDGAEGAIGEVEEAHEVAHGGAAAEVGDVVSVKRGLVIAGSPDLDEIDLAGEAIGDFLPATAVPPFDGEIVFPAGDDEPVGSGGCQGVGSGFFFFGEVDIAPEFGG